MRVRVRYLLLIWIIAGCSVVSAQPRIITSDISNFWTAYDSILKAKEPDQQEKIISDLYLSKASPGLTELIRLRKLTPQRYVEVISKYPRFWSSIRRPTLQLTAGDVAVDAVMGRFNSYFPAATADLFFVIGCVATGGTTDKNHVLIGTEIAAATAATDASELNPSLKNIFSQQQGIDYFVAHELVHTQQGPVNGTLLAQCLKEGVADFMAELMLQRPLRTPYIIYGEAHQDELFSKFAEESNKKDFTNWLYNGSKRLDGSGDAGYFVGYVICKEYYEKATDKEAALKEIRNLEYENSKKLREFVKKSGIYIVR
ncbi:MAG TPA: DUF2268 domain-containing putative Zn-dependent protease [Cyclobacteriaceae bacterium]|nr:hypothetical protein [Cytophagales bacterium]HNP78995.1 DUF2268 domain-containing putative Zn-dependent protease [Cyclobacteriaceae bacterium]